MRRTLPARIRFGSRLGPIGWDLGQFPRIQAPVSVGVPENHLDVVAGLVKWNRLHKFRLLAERPPGLPELGAARACVVGSQDIFLLSAKRIHQVSNVHSSKLYVAIRRKKLRSGKAPHTDSTRQLLACPG